MSLLSIFGTGRRAAPEPALSRLHSQFDASQQAPDTQSTRRELLRVVLRDTLHRHGIPAAWIAGEMLSTTSRNGERGVHWRLHIKHWDARLVTHAVALQQALMRRVVTFDPLASKWLSGVSWQFALDDESECPALPHPTSWTTTPKPAATASASVPEGGMMIGSVHLGSQAAVARDAAAERADLNDLLAIRDADFRQHAAGGAARTWASTEPAKL